MKNLAIGTVIVLVGMLVIAAGVYPWYRVGTLTADSTITAQQYAANNATHGGFMQFLNGSSYIGYIGTSGSFLNDSSSNMAIGNYGTEGTGIYNGANSMPALYVRRNGFVAIGDTSTNHVLKVTGSITADSTILTGGYVSSASDQSFTNSTTQTNVTGLSVPLQANTTYSFTAQLFTSVAASAGEATSVYYGGNTPTYVIYGIVAEDNSVIDVSNWTNTIGTPFSDNTGSAVTPMVKVQGTITTGSTAANLTIRYAQSTAQATANVVKRGSWLHVWQTN